VSEVLQALRYLLLAGLFLFLHRVVRAVGEDVGATDRQPWAVLLVEEGPGLEPGSAFAVRGEALVGRAAESDVVIPDPLAGPQHARLQVAGRGYWVEDLGSPGGTYLNGRRLDAPAPLRHGDRLQVGSTVLRYLQPPGAG
jgi:hypothetical protein